MEFQKNLYNKWRIELFRICVLLALMGTIAEILIYLYDASHRILFLPNVLYQFRFIYIPSTLNLIAIILTWLCLKNKRLSDFWKNTWACLLIYFLCANTQVIHYVYGPLLMLPCVAIFVTILFTDKKLTISIFLASLCSLLLAGYQASRELRKDDPQLISDLLLAALVMLVTLIASMLLTNYVSEQLQYILRSNARQKELIEECNLDPLMGIGNRRAFDSRIDSIHASTKIPSYLFMLDIDNFKAVNDTYGHLAGDEVLSTLGHLIRCESLEAFRYGGEEIVILFTDASLEQAYEKAEKLREAFSAYAFSFAPKKSFTFSAGLAPCTAKEAPDLWIQNADYLLYKAKKNQKNQIIFPVTSESESRQ